jgi:hypothetical protein
MVRSYRVHNLSLKVEFMCLRIVLSNSEMSVLPSVGEVRFCNSVRMSVPGKFRALVALLCVQVVLLATFGIQPVVRAT